MSFQNSFAPDGYSIPLFSTININVIPSFGRIIQLPENQKNITVLFPSTQINDL